MTSLVPVALVLLAAGPVKDVELSADSLVSDPVRHVLRGHAVMRTDDAVLRADGIVYLRAEQVATARGHVTLALATGDLFGAVAETVTLKLDQRRVKEVFVETGKIMAKKGVTAEQLFAVATPAEMEKAGHTAMTLSGTHLARGEGDLWTVDQLALSPCDCDPTEAGFRVESPSATVDVEKRRASILFPTVYVKSVPVFWLPWVNLPLSNRATGLLFPRPTWQGQSGFGLDLPIFVTLGRSYDLTLTPGFFAGAQGPAGVTGPRLGTELRYVPSDATAGKASFGLLYDFRPERDPVTGQAVGNAPASAPSASGLIPYPGPRLPPTFVPARGVRTTGSLQHSQELGSGWHDRIDASFLSDGYYQRDLSADIFVREAGYIRSTGTVFHRGDDLFAGAEVGLIQDLRWGYHLFSPDRDAKGKTLRGPGTIQKLPAIVVALPERPIVGPLAGSLRAEFTRQSPIVSLFGDEGVGANGGRVNADFGAGRVALPTACLQERLFWPGPVTTWVDARCDSSADCQAGYTCQSNVCISPGRVCPAGVLPPDKTGQGDGVFQQGEREARDRLDLRPRLSASFAAGSFARFSPYLAFREDLYRGEVTGQVTHRGYPMAGFVLDTELGRSFGAGEGALRHTIAPSFELRYVPFVLGTAPVPYDDIDLAIPEGRRLLQAVAEVRQRLWRKEGLSSTEVASLDVGQGLDLLDDSSGSRLRDSYARLKFVHAPFNAFGLARVYLGPAPAQTSANAPVQRIAQLSAGLTVDDGRGDAVFVAYDYLFNEGSDQTRRGIDTLVGAPPLLFRPDYAEQVVAGFRLKLKFGLSIDYSAAVGRTSYNLEVPPLYKAAPMQLMLRMQTLGVSYGPACDCWRIEAHALQTPNYDLLAEKKSPFAVIPAVGASLTITGLGSVGTGG